MIYYLHGAFSTHRAFNWLIPQMPEHQHCILEYKTKWSLSQNVSQLEEQITEPASAFVGHSLGGLLAAVMVARKRSQKGISISGPLCGFLFGPAAGWEVFEVLGHTYTTDFLSVVTVNDRVVPQRMQRLARGSSTFESPVNHFEVVLDPDVATAVRNHLFGDQCEG